MFEVILDNGKHSVRRYDNGEIKAFRYGEEWRDLTGDNLIYWMLVEIENLREEVGR